MIQAVILPDVRRTPNTWAIAGIIVTTPFWDEDAIRLVLMRLTMREGYDYRLKDVALIEKDTTTGLNNVFK